MGNRVPAVPAQAGIRHVKSSVGLAFQFFRLVKPRVDHELKLITAAARRIPDPELKRQALGSLIHKRFHCDGGAIYAIQVPEFADVLIPLIVSYQTICDYLDNLCDRSFSRDPEDFRRLHQALEDALTPGAEPRDYYAFRKQRNDAGYLDLLVRNCQKYVRLLPGYLRVRPIVLSRMRLYTDLQVHKHIEPEEREAALTSWWAQHRSRYPGVLWQEFAAAAGSTLEIFALFCLAADLKACTPYRIGALDRAYFPWICSLHILLDYLIDLEEDREGGDLNFVTYYESMEHAIAGIRFVADESRRRLNEVPHPAFHRMIINGLTGYYLADSKVDPKNREIYQAAKGLLRRSGMFTRSVRLVTSAVLPR